MKPVGFVLILSSVLEAAEPSTGLRSYRELKSAPFTSAFQVQDAKLIRDRVEYKFSGTFYVQQEVAGTPRAAVFSGTGVMLATPPPIDFERENLRRFLRTETLTADFRIAVLRFNDSTLSDLDARPAPLVQVPENVRKAQEEFGPRLLRESGMNLDARIALGIANQEAPGFFFAQVQDGTVGRISYVFDPQARIPASIFGINAGEKGVVFRQSGPTGGQDILLAFPSLPELQAGRIAHSESFNLLKTTEYKLKIDVRDPGSGRMSATSELNLYPLRQGVTGLPFQLNDTLGEYDREREKHSLRLKLVADSSGTPFDFVQEPLEKGFTIFLPTARPAREAFVIRIETEGNFLRRPSEVEIERPLGEYLEDAYYPWDSTSWIPRHGFLGRASVQAEILHPPGFTVAASGVCTQERQSAQCRMEQQVPFFGFALGRFVATTAEGNPPIVYHALAKGKQEFMMTELRNGLGFYGNLFGTYPYSRLNAVIQPRYFGQGLASFLLLAPVGDQISMGNFSFIAHEVAHQWWGNLVSWRSYRDQWLSEGFAEYSSMLYTGVRMDSDALASLIRRKRQVLLEPPMTETGVLAGRIAEVGPLILGLRTATRQTLNAYFQLTYGKGALVLRMIHFLLSDPATGKDAAFYEMLKDFVQRYQNSSASTEDFAKVAGEHFARTATARKYGRTNLDWFFKQWVYGSRLPTYRLKYQIDPAASGGVVLSGQVLQSDAGEDWFMPLPLVIRFGKDKTARGTVPAQGPANSFSIPLPEAPSEVQLDPDLWVLSAATETARGRK